MKKIVFSLFTAALIATLFLSCQKTSEAGSDEKACEEARKENTRAAWERYLREFPEGKCVEDGKAVRERFKKIGGYEWSDISDKPMRGDMIEESSLAADAVELGYEDKDDSYCHLLNEDGHTDWRFPTIDELRVLVQNHHGTVSGGICRISYKDGFIDDLTDACKGVHGNNFSKLGDKEKIWSSSAVYMRQSSQFWTVDFSNGELSWKYTFEPLYIRCVRQDDNDACETARKEETDDAWEHYLFHFPKGKCAKEAKAGAKEEAVCERARKANTRAAWEEYLKKFPKGKCAKEGKSVRNKFKRIGNYEWSDVIEYKYDEENILCEDLEEDGHTDWREPNIDELRTLVQNHPGTIAGGKCRISEVDDHLGEDFDDENCKGIGGFNFSKLGDLDFLGTSSDSSMTDYNNMELFWGIDFDNGRLSLSGDMYRYRCVRQDEPEACETAKKYNKSYYWKYYIDNYPQGKCAAVAKAFLGKESTKDKSKSQIDNSKKNGNSEWSKRSRKAMSWKQAKSYCENLKENGSSDWRLPTISELRTLITKCESTETSGACGVTDQCLSAGQCKNKACRGCGRKVKHNKFGDKGFFWSSSISPDNKNAWYIDFTYGSVHNHSNSEKFVRCVR